MTAQPFVVSAMGRVIGVDAGQVLALARGLGAPEAQAAELTMSLCRGVVEGLADREEDREG